MALFSLVNAPDTRAKAVFWLSEIIAGCAFAALMIALLFAPYLLGLLPDVEAQFVGGAK